MVGIYTLAAFTCSVAPCGLPAMPYSMERTTRFREDDRRTVHSHFPQRNSTFFSRNFVMLSRHSQASGGVKRRPPFFYLFCFSASSTIFPTPSRIIVGRYEKVSMVSLVDTPERTRTVDIPHSIPEMISVSILSPTMTASAE